MLVKKAKFWLNSLAIGRSELFQIGISNHFSSNSNPFPLSIELEGDEVYCSASEIFAFISFEWTVHWLSNWNSENIQIKILFSNFKLNLTQIEILVWYSILVLIVSSIFCSLYTTWNGSSIFVLCKIVNRQKIRKEFSISPTKRRTLKLESKY